jgi:hypothetical protein
MDGVGIWFALWLLAAPIAAAVISLGGTGGSRTAR